MIIPTVSIGSESNKVYLDIYSRLLDDRIIFINDEINSHTSGLISAQILHLDAKSNLDSLMTDKSLNLNEEIRKPIYIYINSPGGCIYSGLSVCDMIKRSKSPVYTVVLGLAASAASLILVCGQKRFAYKNSRILIHQPLGGTKGQTTDMLIFAQEMKLLREIISKIYFDNTKINCMEKLSAIMERDTYLSPKSALNLGIIDKILD